MSRPSPFRGRSYVRRPAQPPICEGWIDKYALCRGVFATKGWHRRYVFLTNDGIGFCHSNPREKGNQPANRPLKASLAKTFIPFARKRQGEVELEPVYIIDDVSAARHPAVPQHSHNGICSETVSSNEVNGAGSPNASARDLTKTPRSCTYYYFGLTFEEHRKRYLLLLRTDSPREYIKWTTFLPLFVHEGSAARLVPLGHPLEAGRPQPVDVNYRRLTDKKESTLPSSVTFYFDPDPCTADEYVKVRRMCLGWDEGEKEHLFQSAVDRVTCLCKESDDTATESLTEMQLMSEEQHRRDVERQFDVLGPGVPAYEAQHSPHSKEYVSEDSSPLVGSPHQSRHVDAVDVMADDVSGGNRSRHLTHTFAASPQVVAAQKKKNGRQPGRNGSNANNKVNAHNGKSDAFSDKSMHGATV
ncbi:hypothetical protein NQL31_004911 [Lotmaria passim]